MKFVSQVDIVKQYHVSSKDIPKVMAGLEPEYEQPMGRGILRLYHPVKVAAHLQPLLDKRKAREEAAERKKAKAAKLVSGATTMVASPPVDLAPLAKRLDEAMAAIEQLQADVQTIHVQHASLLRAIEKVGSDLSAKIAAVVQAQPAPLLLGPAVVKLPAEPPPPAPPVLRVEPPCQEPAKTKPRVVVVGLLDSQASLIQNEFGKVFDLTIYAGSELRGKSKGLVSKAANADHVVIMTRFVGHTAEDLVRAAGAKAIRVTGALTDLRDRLTGLFVELGEKPATLAA